MNLWRLLGDMSHLLSIMVLLLKIHATKSCAGVSLRTQELYAIVFLTRYLDLFFSFISLCAPSLAPPHSAEAACAVAASARLTQFTATTQ